MQAHDRNPIVTSTAAGAHVSDPGEQLKFPVEFELRIIFLAEADGGDGAIEQDIQAALSVSGARYSTIRRLHTNSDKYRRIAVPISFENQQAMREAYAALGTLPYIKAVL